MHSHTSCIWDFNFCRHREPSGVYRGKRGSPTRYSRLSDPSGKLLHIWALNWTMHVNDAYINDDQWTDLYWSCTTKYQPILPYTDSVPSSTNHRCPMLTLYTASSPCFCVNVERIIWRDIFPDNTTPSKSQWPRSRTQLHLCPRSTSPQSPSAMLIRLVEKIKIPSKLEVAPPPKCLLDGWSGVGDTP